MNRFTTHAGIATPLFQANIDTDQIIPKQFLKSIKRTGFGVSLFYDWRYLDNGEANPEFVLNQPRYEGASILITGKNFGCGSSREHAPWALAEYGFKVIIAPSFADIFYNNSLKTGLLPIILDEEKCAKLAKNCESESGYMIIADLEKCNVSDNKNFSAGFEINDFSRHSLLNGLDDISLTLQHEPEIFAFEKNHFQLIAAQ